MNPSGGFHKAFVTGNVAWERYERFDSALSLQNRKTRVSQLSPLIPKRFK